MRAVLTAMDEPLGRAVGHALEVAESIDCLRDRGPADTMAVTYALGEQMLVLAKAANSPAEALDRITIPPEAMARIAEALTTGGSIVVSDQGINQGETGEGTDFIVSLR